MTRSSRRAVLWLLALAVVAPSGCLGVRDEPPPARLPAEGLTFTNETAGLRFVLHLHPEDGGTSAYLSVEDAATRRPVVDGSAELRLLEGPGAGARVALAQTSPQAGVYAAHDTPFARAGAYLVEARLAAPDGALHAAQLDVRLPG